MRPTDPAPARPRAAARAHRLGSVPDSAGFGANRLPGPALTRGFLALMVLAALAALALALTGGAEEVVARGDPPAADGPVGPLELGLAVEVPESVVAGQRAHLVVRWTDGSGTFSGSSEDWGDAVATSSRKQSRCEPAAVPAPAAGGRYVLRHAWGEAGTYTVVIGVATYTCESGSAVEDEATKTLTIEVLPAG